MIYVLFITATMTILGTYPTMQSCEAMKDTANRQLKKQTECKAFDLATPFWKEQDHTD